jgi:hypothetical protein
MEGQSFNTCIKEAHSALFEYLELNKIIKSGETFDLANLFDEESEYEKMWFDPDASYWLGYLDGIADTLGLTIRELLDQYYVGSLHE